MKNIADIIKKILLILCNIIYNLFLFLVLLLFLSSIFGILIGLLLAIFIFIIYILIRNKLKEYFLFSIIKKLLRFIVFLTILIFLNSIFVFYYNKYYYNIHPNQATMVSIDEENYEITCEQDVFNDSIEMPSFAIPPLYKYHTPKSNPILPTLGIRYKAMYKEERGYVVIYEKRSYLNIYVGDGKVLCANDGDLETLE